MSSLEHHGIKGQKWGVRRFQNPDGTRTALGKKHYSVEAVDVESTRKDIKDIVQKFSKKDKQMFFDRHYYNDKYDRTDEEIAKRFVVKEGRDIVAFIDAQTSRHNSDLNMVIGTAQCARGKGYAATLSKRMVDWYESEGYKDYGSLEWNAYSENIGSRKAAEKAGFKQVSGDHEESNYLYDKKAKKELDRLSSAFNEMNAVQSEVKERINSDFGKTLMGKFSPITRFHANGRTYWDGNDSRYNSQSRTKATLIDSYAELWAKKKHGQDIKEYKEKANDYTRAYGEYYKKRNKVNHSSIGGNMNYIYGNTLVLGDSSYLEHHGIKGQRWGVRRFQNKDGSLTNAGRKRLGYSTKDVKSAVIKGGKAVGGAAVTIGKAGYNLGRKVAAAGKAHSEKKKAEKLEKKKEKASKTRLGVIANSDLFTAKEMEELNKKFKTQDEMTIASLKKGADIVTNIATIAKGVNDINSAVEGVTGMSLNPLKNVSNETKRQKEAAELEQARQNAKKAASQAENEATKAEKTAYEFNKQKDHDKEKEAKKQQGKSTNPNDGGNGPKPTNPNDGGNGPKPTNPNDGGNGPKPTNPNDGGNGPKPTNPNDGGNGPKPTNPTGSSSNHMPDIKRIAQAEKPKELTEHEANKQIVKDMLNMQREASNRIVDTSLSERRKVTPSMNAKIIYDDYTEKINTKAANAVDSVSAKAAKTKESIKNARPDKVIGRALEKKADKIVEERAKKRNAEQDKAIEYQAERLAKFMEDPRMNKLADRTPAQAKKDFVKIQFRNLGLRGNQLDDAVDKYIRENPQLFKHSAINLDSQALVHYGLKGQRWGVRRFQNPDGTRTEAGKARYGKSNTEFSGGGGGGAPEEDDKAKTIAEALGIDVDEYRKKVDNSPLGYKHAADKLDVDAKKLHEQAEANRRMADQAKSSGYKDKAREFERNAEKCEKQAKSKEGLRDYCQWRADGGTVIKATANAVTQTIDATANAVGRVFDATANTLHDLNPGNYSIENKRGRIKIHKKPYVSKFTHGLLIDEDGTLYLEHHGIKGQKWGVRRFRNADGTLTDKGRKHYQKKLDREKRKQVSSDNLRGTLERRHGLAVGASGIISAITGALTVAAMASNPATIAAGAAISAAVSAGITHGSYSIAEAWEGRGSRIRKKKIARYEDMLKQDAFIVEDGTLYLEHFGIKNMKWGVRRFQNKDGSLTDAGRKRYGSGNDGEEHSGGGGGGGAPEEDEEMKKKIEEAAKKAGMTVAEYRKKMGSKLYDMFGGKYKKEAEDLRKRQLESSKNARLLEKEGGTNYNEDANIERVNAKIYSHFAKEANKSYEKSIAGRYDKLKATIAERGKAKKKEASEEKRKERRHRSTTSQRGIKQRNVGSKSKWR